MCPCRLPACIISPITTLVCIKMGSTGGYYNIKKLVSRNGIEIAGAFQNYHSSDQQRTLLFFPFFHYFELPRGPLSLSLIFHLYISFMPLTFVLNTIRTEQGRSCYRTPKDSGSRPLLYMRRLLWFCDL